MTWKSTVAEEAGNAGKTLKEVREQDENIHFTSSVDIPLSLSSTSTTRSLPLARSQPIVSHHH
jgi:hypothetical protein